MRFSVIIPLYNKEKYIEDTIKSVLNQSCSDYEIIVIDDGSTDNGYSIVKNMNHEKINIISQKNQGVSTARNNGIMAAKGDYVCFLDADDEWTTNFLETINFLIEKYTEASMFCTRYQIKYKNKITTPKFKGIDNNLPHGLINNYFYTSTSKHSIINSSCTAVKKKEILETGLFSKNDRVGEDLDMWLRFAENHKIAYSKNICSIYNRTTTDNARTRNLIHYPEAYLNTLISAYNSDKYSIKDKYYIKKVYDKKMTAYIFSLINCEMKKEASEVIDIWKPHGEFRILKIGLKIALHFPYMFVDVVNKIRIQY